MAFGRFRRVFFLLAGPLLGLGTAALLGGLPPEQRIMGGLFTLTVFYWIAEPIPLYVTGILAAFLSALFLGPLAPHFGGEVMNYRQFLHPFASPVVVLLFGGFVMAKIVSKLNLDLEFAQTVLSRLGGSPSRLLGGLMLLTAFMSMWMSNTATTAIMVAAVLPLVRSLPEGSNLSKAFLIGIAFSANVGGIATPVGTPPNAIALGLLAESGQGLSFFTWMVAALPVATLLLALVFVLLRYFFPVKGGSIHLEIPKAPRTMHRKKVYATFGLTVLLWVTDAFHHIPPALVALLPVIAFSAGGLLDKRELRDLNWDILLLVGGGLALGTGIKETGLGDSLVAALDLGGVSPLILTLGMSLLIALVATFMSNSAAANTILPIAMTVAAAGESVPIIVTVTLCASLGMALPISTPPNAIAYSSEMLRVKDMAKVGVLVTLVGVLLTLFFERFLFQALPMLAAATS